MVDKRILENFDWWLFLATLLLMTMGFVNLNSASAATGYPFQYKQLQWYAAGTFAMLLCLCVDYRALMVHSFWIYLGTLILLGLVLVAGKTVGGSQRWLSLGFFNIQPSEIAKLSMAIVLSSYFYNDEKPEYGFMDLIRPLILTAIPVGLIYPQPDLGTALLLVFIFVSITYLVKIRWTTIVSVLAFILSAIPMGWSILKPYQKKRVEAFLNPESDPYGAGYHLIQSKIAVGSGGLWGKGYMHGTQAHLNFLPEVHTDFAFSIWAEEWGLLGAAFLLIIYAVIVYRGLIIASHSRERFGAFLAFGITAMIFWQMLVNACMVVGLMPVVGIPLPLISYGGSSVIVTLMGIGILLNIQARKFMFQQSSMHGWR